MRKRWVFLALLGFFLAFQAARFTYDAHRCAVTVSNITDAQIQTQLEALGFSVMPQDDREGAGAGTDGGIVRFGNAANNTLGAAGGADLLRGYEGNDVLLGHEGFDTYVFQVGDGDDTIYDASAEGGRVRFLANVDLSAVSQTEVDNGEDGQNLLISYGNGDTITLMAWSSFSQATQDAWVFESVASPVFSPNGGLAPDPSCEHRPSRWYFWQ